MGTQCANTDEKQREHCNKCNTGYKLVNNKCVNKCACKETTPKNEQLVKWQNEGLTYVKAVPASGTCTIDGQTKCACSNSTLQYLNTDTKYNNCFYKCHCKHGT